MYFEFLFLRAHFAEPGRAQVLVRGQLVFANDLFELGDREGVIGPMGSGLPQFGFPRRFAMKLRPRKRWNKLIAGEPA